MGEFRVKIEKLAESHLKKHFKVGNQGSVEKINQILDELGRTPYEGVGKPEAFKHKLSGFWPREINSKDRIIYKVQEDIVPIFVISASGYYSDK